MLNFRELLPLL